MDSASVPLFAVLLLSIASLAGCIGGDGGEVKVPAPPLGVTGGNNTTLGAFDPPVWEVGQWWAHHTYFGPDDKTGNHFNVIVVDDANGSYTVASESGDHAYMDAEEDLFDLGSFSTDLETTRGGTAWKWYAWPLEHNKTWTQSISIDGEVYDLTLRASEAQTLRTARGAEPGFDINGTLDDGTLVLNYDYVPKLGWLSDLDLYDPTAPDAPIFKIRNMGYGTGKAAEYVQVSLHDVVDTTYDGGAGPVTDSLEVPQGTTRLLGEIRLIAELGAATLTLTDPDGATEEYTAVPPEGADGETVERPDPPAGTWELSLLGAGDGISAYVSLMAVVETTGSVG